jgi:hypothetical protein
LFSSCKKEVNTSNETKSPATLTFKDAPSDVPSSLSFLTEKGSANLKEYDSLLTSSDFEAESEFKNWSEESCRSNGITISTEEARTGNSSARFELTKNDFSLLKYTRAELHKNSPSQADNWYGFSNYLPSDFVKDPIPENLAQWHEVPDWSKGEIWRSPPISFRIKDDHYYLIVLWSAKQVNNYGSKDGEKDFDLGPVDKGQWNDWVFHINFSYGSDGVIEVWKNKQQLVSYNGPNSYNDEHYPYFKVGIYKWGWNGWANYSPEDKRVLFFDNVKIGNQNSSFDQVSP